MNADVVSVDDAKTTTSTVKKFTDITDYIEAIEESINDSSAKNFAYDLAVYLKNLTNGEGYKDFDPFTITCSRFPPTRMASLREGC